MKGRKKYISCRLAMLLCIAMLAVSAPGQVLAGESRTVTRELYHLHTGNKEEGNGCYTKAVFHIHQGNAGEKGGCYTYPVYHIHTGNEKEGGGCFGEKVFHIHKGSEAAGGDCYRTPVYHTHTGSAAAGGGCYNRPVLHKHSGTETDGGTCYEPVYHVHAASCYLEETCTMKYEGGLQVESTYNMYCYHHGDTQHASITGNYSHSSCGQGITRERKDICWTCRRLDKKHTFAKIICGRTERTIEGYRLSCPKTEQTADSFQLGCGKSTAFTDCYKRSCTKTEQTIDSYKRNCGKNEKSVDAYARNCGKTEDTTETYEPGCGLEEGEAFARMTLINTDTEWTSGSVRLEAAVTEEKGEGVLALKEEAFIWEGGSKPEGADASQRKASENGVYTVRLNLAEGIILQEEPVLSIEVKNVDHTAPVIEELSYDRKESVSSNIIHIKAVDPQPDGSEGSGLAAEPYSYDGGNTWCAASGKEIKNNGTVQIRVRDRCGNIASASADIDNIRIEEPAPAPKPEPKPQLKPDKKPEPVPEPQPEKEAESAPAPEPEYKPEIKPDKIPEKSPEENPQSNRTTQPSKTPSGGGNGESGTENGMAPAKPDGKALPIPFERPEKTVKKVRKKKAGADSVKQEQDKQKQILPAAAPVKEKKTVQPEPVMEDRPEEKIQVKTVTDGLLPSAAKAAAFTFGSVAGVSSLLWLLFILFRNIKIYYYDGEGKSHYAGSCIIKKKEDIFEVELPDRILQQSETGEYMLRPFYLFARQNKGKELVVTAGENKKSVWIDPEIPLRLKTYV